MTKKILILGGTAEAAALAERLHEAQAPFEVTTSLTGRTRFPNPIPGRVLTGGFGGIAGLKAFVETEKIDIVVDATHPYAEVISENAYVACLAADVLRVMLIRPPWPLPPDGKWLEVDNMEAVAEALPRVSKRPFLTIGRRGLEAFSSMPDIHFLVRLIEEPREPLPLADYELITGRPPHHVEEEKAIIADHGIDCLVSKHSGGSATEAKITAALEAGIRIVLQRRPVRLPGLWTESADECFDWLMSQV